MAVATVERHGPGERAFMRMVKETGYSQGPFRLMEALSLQIQNDEKVDRRLERTAAVLSKLNDSELRSVFLTTTEYAGSAMELTTDHVLDFVASAPEVAKNMMCVITEYPSAVRTITSPELLREAVGLKDKGLAEVRRFFMNRCALRT
jgi:hypothetical protein